MSQTSNARSRMKIKHGVIGKDGQPVTRITVIAPELHHVSDKPPVGGLVRYTDCSIGTRRQRAYAGSRHTRTSGNALGDLITNRYIVALTWIGLLGVSAAGAMGLI